ARSAAIPSAVSACGESARTIAPWRTQPPSTVGSPPRSRALRRPGQTSGVRGIYQGEDGLVRRLVDGAVGVLARVVGVMIGRHLDWAGCVNVRDLGGLPTSDGRTTRWRAVVRADNLDRLTPQGWAALDAYGVRTVVDLREDEERSTAVSR